MRATRRDVLLWLPSLLLAGMLALLYYPLLSGETLFWGLPTLQFYPWREFAFEQLREGHLPAWNPYLGAGAPLLANQQTAVFYPPNWLWLVLPGAQAMSFVAVLHVLWAGLGMWCFTGTLGFTPFGRGISALAYAFSGYLIARLGSFPTANAGAWIPWLFWLVQRVLAQRRAPDVGWLGIAFGLQLLAGHAQTTWYGVVSVGLYALWHTAWHMRRDRLQDRVHALLAVGVGLLLGVLVAAVQLIPTLEYLAQSQRSDGLDYATITNLSYHPIRLLTLLSPDFFGTPADGSYLTEGLYFEESAYIGFVPLIAAVAAIWAWLRQVRSGRVASLLVTVPFWSGLALVGFALALGKYGPFYRVLYDRVPTFDAFREPVRWLILPVLALAVLAGAGVEQWGRGKWNVFWSRLAAAGGGAMMLLALAGLHIGDFPRTLAVLSWGMVVLGAWTVMAALLTLVQPLPPLVGSSQLWRVTVLVFVALDLAWVGSGLNPMVPADFFEPRAVDDIDGRVYWFEDYQHATIFGSDSSDGGTQSHESVSLQGFFDVSDYRVAVKQLEALRMSLLPDITLIDRVPALSNNDPLQPGHYRAYVDLIEDLGQAAGPLLQAAGVGRVYGMVPEGWLREEALVAAAPYDPAQAWLVPEADWFASAQQVEAALRDPSWDPMQRVILAEPLPEQRAGDVAAPAAGEVARVSRMPTEHRYHVTAERPMVLVIAETWYPGWSATVNGSDARLYRANLAFMALPVPGGESVVVLRYNLTNWPSALAVTLVALLAALILVAIPLLLRLVRPAYG